MNKYNNLGERLEDEAKAKYFEKYNHLLKFIFLSHDQEEILVIKISQVVWNVCGNLPISYFNIENETMFDRRTALKVLKVFLENQYLDRWRLASLSKQPRYLIVRKAERENPLGNTSV